MKKTMLMLGTRKGAFLAFSDTDRRRFELSGPFLKGVEVNHLNWVRNGLMATVKSAWWGPDVRTSTDFGETWKEPARGIRFDEGRNLTVSRVWVTESGPDGTLYAGVDPGALFRSPDGGETWEEVRALTDHETRSRWFPGAGGMMVHSIGFDSTNPNRMFVGISAAGVFRTDDGGKKDAGR